MKLLKTVSLSTLLVSGIAVAEPAAVIKEGNCGFPTPSGAYVMTDDTLVVSTNSAVGNVKLQCKAKIPEYDEGQSTRTDLLCGIAVAGGGYILTEDSRLQISESGRAILTCRYKEDSTP